MRTFEEGAGDVADGDERIPNATPTAVTATSATAPANAAFGANDADATDAGDDVVGHAPRRTIWVPSMAEGRDAVDAESV